MTLIPVLHFFIRGHSIFPLVGGATGKVGDPAGKSAEREKIASDTVAHNVDALAKQLAKFVRNGSAYAETRGYDASQFGQMKVINNADWYSGLRFMDFMNDVGRNVRLSTMLARDSVKNRLSGDGMSYGEFSYQLLQAYDFWQLHRQHGVSLQIGGSDQYGNITAGIDLVSRLQTQSSSHSTSSTSASSAPSTTTQEVFGLTVPLLTTPSGEKFGKSAGNAIWLDPSLTSPFELYQYFLRTPDSHIETYLKLFTLIPLPEIVELADRHRTHPAGREANRILANDVVTLVHGPEACERIDIANRILFPGDFVVAGGGTDGTSVQAPPFSATRILTLFRDDPALVTLQRDLVVGQRISTLLRSSGAVKSSKEGAQLIRARAVRCGERVVADPTEIVDPAWLLEGRLLLIKIGKNKFTFISVED